MNKYEEKNFSAEDPSDKVIMGRGKARGSMVISDFTRGELDFLRNSCNFVSNETGVFELRSQGLSLEEIAEVLNLSVDGVKKVSRKVNKKINRVL